MDLKYLPKSIQEFYERNGETVKIQLMEARKNGTYRVYFNKAYDLWTRDNKTWRYEVHYIE